MPLTLTPAPESPIPPKRVAPPAFDIAREWFEIKSFTHDTVLREARTKATRTTLDVARRPKEEIDNDAFLYHVLKSQVVDWHVYDPAGTLIPFNDANLRALPWDVKGFLFDEIQACGGIIPTEQLVVQTESGTPLDYKRPDAGLGTGDAQTGVSDPQ